jgi:hypothetical protein
MTAMPGSAVNLWTVVQWQDFQGDWHDVDGWRAPAKSGQHVRWWVAAKDAGTGPFRWFIYDRRKDQRHLWTSEPFYLPMPGVELLIEVGA